MASMDLKMPETPFWYLRFYFIRRKKKYWSNSISCSNKIRLTFNGNWVSMYDPIKIDPYVLLTQQKKSKTEQIPQFLWKSCFFIIILFHFQQYFLFPSFSFTKSTKIFTVHTPSYILNEEILGMCTRKNFIYFQIQFKSNQSSISIEFNEHK